MPSLTERKRATRRTLAAVARQLVDVHGVGGFTVDDVAAAANVSRRTFFNYFASKEAAIIGVDDELLSMMTREIAARPAAESALLALQAVFLTSDEELSAIAESMVERVGLVVRHPDLMARHLAAINDVESALATGLARRAGVAVADDPMPTVVAAAWVGVWRSTMTWWTTNGRPGTIEAHLRRAFDRLATGMINDRPEDPC